MLLLIPINILMRIWKNSHTIRYVTIITFSTNRESNQFWQVHVYHSRCYENDMHVWKLFEDKEINQYMIFILNTRAHIWTQNYVLYIKKDTLNKRLNMTSCNRDVVEIGPGYSVDTSFCCCYCSHIANDIDGERILADLLGSMY